MFWTLFGPPLGYCVEVKNKGKGVHKNKYFSCEILQLKSFILVIILIYINIAATVHCVVIS
jgi:hypothetical protein